MYHTQNLEQERLFRLIASLTGCLDKQVVIETMETILDVKAIEKDDCVFFDEFALTFDNAGRVTSMCRIIDGTSIPAGFDDRRDVSGANDI